MQEPLVSRILRTTLYIGFIVGVLLTVTLPFMIDYYFALLYDVYSVQVLYRQFITAFLMITGVAGCWVIFELIIMMRSVPDNPFIRRNGKALNRIGIIFSILAVMFFGKCLIYVTFLTLLGGIIFVIGGLFTFTLASLFFQAVEYREENELTI